MSMVSFKQLSDAIEFLAGHLENGRHEAIADQCRDSLQDSERAIPGLPSPREYRLRAIQALAQRHAERSLRSLYRWKTFPLLRKEFKLGGHAKELGHIHVDFDRSETGWCLKEVSICR
jgi:hypothetical protein